MEAGKEGACDDSSGEESELPHKEGRLKWGAGGGGGRNSSFSRRVKLGGRKRAEIRLMPPQNYITLRHLALRKQLGQPSPIKRSTT